MHESSAWMWAMWAGMFLFWAALVGFAVWAVQRFTPRSRLGTARRILAERFARGEIDAEEFRSRTRALED